MRHASKLAHTLTRHTHAHTHAHRHVTHVHVRGRAVRAARAGVCMVGDMCCVCCAWLCVRCACVPMDMACTRMVSGAQVRADMPPPHPDSQGVRASHGAGAARGCQNPSRAERVAMPPPRPDGPGRPGKSCCGCCARLLESITRAACGHAPSPPGWSKASGQVMMQPAHARAQGVWCACGACVRVCGARARCVCGARAVHRSPGTRRQRLHRRGRSSCSSCVVIVSSRFLCAAPAEERSGCAEESSTRCTSPDGAPGARSGRAGSTGRLARQHRHGGGEGRRVRHGSQSQKRPRRSFFLPEGPRVHTD